MIIVTSKNCFTNRSKDVVHLAERRCNLNFLQTKLHNKRISAAAVTFLFWRSPPRDFVRMKLFYCGFNGFGQVEHLGANECSSQKIGTCLPMLIYQSETDRVLHVFLGWSRLIITTSKNIFLIIHSFHWFKQWFCYQFNSKWFCCQWLLEWNIKFQGIHLWGSQNKTSILMCLV